MKTAQQWFDLYAESHKNSVNKLIHWICVPAIFFSIYVLLRAVPIIQSQEYAHWINLGNLMLGLTLVFYFRTSWRIALGMTLFAVVVFVVGNYFIRSFAYPSYVALGIFTLAWIGQFIGHKIEGKKPSFFTDLQFLLIGPAWLMSFIYKKLNISI